MQNGGDENTGTALPESKLCEAQQKLLSLSSTLDQVEGNLNSIQEDLSKSQEMPNLSGSEEAEASEISPFILDKELEHFDGEPILDTASKLLHLDPSGTPDLRTVDPETLEALLEAAGIDKLTTADGKAFTDPEILRKLTSSVSSALDEAAAALNRMRAENAAGIGNETADGASYMEDSDKTAGATIFDDEKAIHETTEEGESLLSLACSGGYFELAQVLLKMNAAIEDRGLKGDCTPLMEAASGGHVDVVRLLIEYGAHVNSKSQTGNTALMYACSGGHEDVVQVLLEHGANIEDHNENGHTPLMEAASCGHVEVARLLLMRGAGINTHSNEFKESALTLACYKGHLEMVKFLLEAGADHEHKTDEMHTALMEASMDGHVEVAQLLLDHGAQVNMPADSFESPLTLAACGGHVDLAALLIDRGANIEEVNDEGYTPLMEAAREGHEEMVALLLAQGANINAQTEETQETALTLACCGGFLEVAKFLIEVGADMELGCSTPLMEASQEGHVELVKYLLYQGANVHATTATGDTALTYACENGHTDVADVLLAFGANLEHESEGGRTPLMKASRAGHLCTVQFLISRGANVNRATTNNDHTVLSLACAGGHLSVVELLLAHGANPTHKLKDGSTSLIEAAKGGHSQVVDLLLEYPANMVQASLPMDGSITPPIEQQGEIPRVPTQSLPMVVPPQEPDKHPQEGSPMVGPPVVIPGALSGIAGQSYQDLPNAIYDPSNQSDANPESYVKFFNNVPCSFENVAKWPSEFTTTSSSPSPKRQKTAEEQILEKQQIIAELQKVERELQERMEAQKALSQLTASKVAAQFREVVQSRQFAAHNAANLIREEIDEMAEAAAEANNNKSRKGPFDGEEDDSGLGDSEIQLMRASENVYHEQSDGGAEGSGEAVAIQGVINAKYTEQDEEPEPFILTDEESIQSDKLIATHLAQAVFAPTLPLPDVQTLLARTGQVNEVEQGLIGEGTQTPWDDVMTETSDKEQLLAAVVDTLQDAVNAVSDAECQEDIKKPIPVTHSVGTQCGYPAITTDLVQQITPPTPQSKAISGPASPADFDIVPPPELHAPVEIDARTESNHDTALTIACASGHDEVIKLLLEKGSNLEHRDKKGFTPLILGATAGHTRSVELLLHHGAEIEAQSERTKDTPLSLACSGGRYEVVDLLLSRGANKEHRNVSDYTPLSLAASGGYVKIIKLLLRHGAEINSRTGSKLGISPLMLAAMNGHTAAVELLLDMGSDINAQIETNRNTALTLACFQGRTEVVSLLVDRKANVEHRAKTGLTPLMEAASGGYADVGRVLIEKGADVNAAPVPSSRDTALTIAADKGHYRFVELLLQYGALVDAKNKKGNSPLWLSCNGGHLEVVQLLVNAKADIDSQDNRKVSCLMAAFRKGHVKVVKWMVKHVNQFPSDTECMRFIATISDKELLKKCHQCMEIIVTAKDRQAAEANRNANILLEELESEKSREENRKAAAAKRKEKKKLKKREKKAVKPANDQSQEPEEEDDEEDEKTPAQIEETVPIEPPSATTTTTIGKVRTTDTVAPQSSNRKEKAITKTSTATRVTTTVAVVASTKESEKNEKNKVKSSKKDLLYKTSGENTKNDRGRRKRPSKDTKANSNRHIEKPMVSEDYNGLTPISLTKNARMGDNNLVASVGSKTAPSLIVSPKRGQRRDDGWMEVVRRSKKVAVPGSAISRVIGRGGCNINAIREVTGAHIDVDKQNKGGERTINIKGSADSTRHAHQLINALIKDPNKELDEIIPKFKKAHLSHNSSVVTATVTSSTARINSATYSSTTQRVSTIISSSSQSMSKNTSAKISASNGKLTNSISSVTPSYHIHQSASQTRTQPHGVDLSHLSGIRPKMHSQNPFPVGYPPGPSVLQRHPTATMVRPPAPGMTPAFPTVRHSPVIRQLFPSEPKQIPMPPDNSSVGMHIRHPAIQTSGIQPHRMPSPGMQTPVNFPNRMPVDVAVRNPHAISGHTPPVQHHIGNHSMIQPAVGTPNSHFSEQVISRPTSVGVQSTMTPSSVTVTTTTTRTYNLFSDASSMASTDMFRVGPIGQPPQAKPVGPISLPETHIADVVEKSKAPGFNRSGPISSNLRNVTIPASILSNTISKSNVGMAASAFRPQQNSFPVAPAQTSQPFPPSYSGPSQTSPCSPRDLQERSQLNVNAQPFVPVKITPSMQSPTHSSASQDGSPGASPRSSTESSSPVLSNDTSGLSDRKLRPIGTERSRQQQRRTPTGFPTLPSGTELGNQPCQATGISIWSYKPGDGGNSWLHTSPQSVEESLLENHKLHTSGVIGRRTNVEGDFHMNAAMMTSNSIFGGWSSGTGDASEKNVWSDWSSTM
ncbi:ankyrin repeat domain-containing protein 17-like [Antedon mediterranea]|uniref:ankyrin repeat domain-containing protein 17-like n=1 Tax=Antedon mediterranea TaxID=105859 RepID=UPI003AF54E85